MSTRRRGLAVGLVASVLAGCGAPHPGLSNGSVSACYRAIPVARGAVHDTSASLIGLHRIAVDSVRDRLPAGAADELTRENDSVVCAVAFKGNFSAGQVDSAPAAEAGPYAIVLVSSRRLHLVAAVVLTKLPRSLGGRFV